MTTSGSAPRVPLAAGPLADAPLGVASLDREGARDDPQGEPPPPVTFVCAFGHVTPLSAVAERDKRDLVIRCRYSIGAVMQCSREAVRMG